MQKMEIILNAEVDKEIFLRYDFLSFYELIKLSRWK